jgi:hypothetical protein
MDFVELGQSRTKIRAYNDAIETAADVDSFTQLSPLSLADARAQIKDIDTNDIKSLVIYGPNGILGPATIVMPVGSTVQLVALAYTSRYHSPAISPDAIGFDSTTNATWYIDPIASPVATVSKGIVTAAASGTIVVYAIIGNFMSNDITITVS